MKKIRKKGLKKSTKFNYKLDRPWPHFSGIPDGLIMDYIGDITDREIKEKYSGFTGFIKRSLGALRLYKKPVKDKEEISSRVMSAFYDAVSDNSEVELLSYKGADCIRIETKDSEIEEKLNEFRNNTNIYEKRELLQRFSNSSLRALNMDSDTLGHKLSKKNMSTLKKILAEDIAHKKLQIFNFTLDKKLSETFDKKNYHVDLAGYFE